MVAGFIAKESAPERSAGTPGSVPVLRGLAALAAYRAFHRDPIAALNRLYKRHGRLFAIGRVLPFGPERRYYVGVDGEINRRVLTDVDTFRAVGLVLKGPEGSAQNRLRRGLVGMHGKEHRYYRQLFMPPFRRPNVEAAVQRMDEIVAHDLAEWPLDRPMDLWPPVKQMVRRLSVRILFGGHEDNDEAEQVADHVDRFMKLSIWGGLGAIPLDWPGLPYRKMLRHSEATEAAILAWAAKRRQQQREDDLLSILIAQPDHRGKPASPRTIAGHIPVLFGASYETCQAGLGWSLFLLAQHPQVAERLADELAGGNGKEPAYLDWVVREAMRLFPPVPYQARRVAEDTELLGEIVPKNSRIFISALMTNRNPAIYAEPNRFKPERWANLNPSAYEYLTFSAGPRTCIGLWFGMTAVKRALAGIVRHAKVELSPGARIGHYVAVTMGPKPGLPGILRAPGGAWRQTPATGPATDLIELPA